MPTDLNAANWERLCDVLEPHADSLDIDDLLWHSARFSPASRRYVLGPRLQTPDACRLTPEQRCAAMLVAIGAKP